MVKLKRSRGGKTKKGYIAKRHRMILGTVDTNIIVEKSWSLFSEDSLNPTNKAIENLGK